MDNSSESDPCELGCEFSSLPFKKRKPTHHPIPHVNTETNRQRSLNSAHRSQLNIEHWPTYPTNLITTQKSEGQTEGNVKVQSGKCTNLKQHVEFSPMPSTSKDERTFVENEKLLNKVTSKNNNDRCSHDTIDVDADDDNDDIQIVEVASEVIVIDDNDEDDDCVIVGSLNQVKENKQTEEVVPQQMNLDCGNRYEEEEILCAESILKKIIEDLQAENVASLCSGNPIVQENVTANADTPPSTFNIRSTIHLNNPDTGSYDTKYPTNLENNLTRSELYDTTRTMSNNLLNDFINRDHINSTSHCEEFNKVNDSYSSALKLYADVTRNDFFNSINSRLRNEDILNSVTRDQNILRLQLDNCLLRMKYFQDGARQVPNNSNNVFNNASMCRPDTNSASIPVNVNANNNNLGVGIENVNNNDNFDFQTVWENSLILRNNQNIRNSVPHTNLEPNTNNEEPSNLSNNLQSPSQNLDKDTNSNCCKAVSINQAKEKNPEDQIKDSSFNEPNGLGNCPVCFENLSSNSLASTKCGHVFCLLCIKKTVSLFHRCPICLTKLGYKSYHKLFLGV